MIINQILEMARIESGTAVLQLKAEDMDALFHRVNTVFEEDVRKKNLQYHAVLDVRHHYVVCDQTKLQEIMLNIISNAIKYTRRDMQSMWKYMRQYQRILQRYVIFFFM